MPTTYPNTVRLDVFRGALKAVHEIATIGAGTAQPPLA